MLSREIACWVMWRLDVLKIILNTATVISLPHTLFHWAGHLFKATGTHQHPRGFCDPPQWRQIMSRKNNHPCNYVWLSDPLHRGSFLFFFVWALIGLAGLLRSQREKRQLREEWPFAADHHTTRCKMSGMCLYLCLRANPQKPSPVWAARSPEVLIGPGEIKWPCGPALVASDNFGQSAHQLASTNACDSP